MVAPNRQAALEERAALIERLAALPAAMRALPQWLLWKLERKEGSAKPTKVPYYVSGKKRVGTQGDEADRKALVSFEAAIARLRGAMHFSGLGFAFLPGDGLVGIDIDGAIAADTGEVSELCDRLIESCASYTETSPSGRGVHIIVRGETESFRANGIGLECYSGRQYFTCTGRRWSGTPADVQGVDPAVFAYMHELAGATAKAAAAPGAGASVGGDSLVGWLEQALGVLDPNCAYNEWIGIGMALKSALGDAGLNLWDYWSSKAGDRYAGARVIASHWKSFKGDDAEGALTIFKMARKGNRWRPGDDWLAVYGSESQRARIAGRHQRPHLRIVSRDSQHDDAVPAGADPRPEPPPDPHEEGMYPRRRPRSRGSGRNANPPDGGVGGGLTRLSKSFRLIYGTDAVWDGEQRITMAVKNLRLLFGNDAVKMWLASPDRRLVLQQDMVFEPGAEVGEVKVNLFDGLPMQATACEEADVAVMLELLRHLCSKSADDDDGLRAVERWVTSWLAYPLQNVGAKMRTALVFHGPQGTGKNLFFDCIRSMYGKYGRMVGQTELDDKFNDWLSAKLLIVGNEVVTRQELFHNKNKLKWIVTEDEIPIRGMHQTVRWESNHANVVFLSNESQPIALEKDDRRHVVVYTPAANDELLYLRVAEFLKDGGASKFLHYLQQYDTERFGEHTRPIMTEAKQALIELSLKPAERFVNEWLQGLLPLPVQVCSAEQLYRVFRRWCDMTGERFPPPQAQFTKTCERHVLERMQRDPVTRELLEPKLRYKIVTLKHDLGYRKSMRCWLPRGIGPPEGETEGEWGTSCVAAFETHVARYGRTSTREDEP